MKIANVFIICLILIIGYDANLYSRDWARQIGKVSSGGLGSEYITCVKKYDNDGGMLVGGFFSTDTLSPMLANTTSNSQSSDAFISYCTPTGGINGINVTNQSQLLIHIGGQSSEFIYDFDIDSARNIYVVGSFQGNADLGNGIVLSANQKSSGFIAKYNSVGICQWAKAIGGNSDFDRALTIDIDSNTNSIYVGGIFTGMIQLGNNISLTTPYYQLRETGYLIKYNLTGECQWAKALGYEVRDIVIDYNSSICIVGNYGTGSIDFGNQIYVGSNYQNAGFVAKYNSAGLCQWAKGLSNGYCSLTSITADISDNIVIGGEYSGSLTVEPNVPANNLNSTGAGDGCIIKYNSSGVCQWSKSIGNQQSSSSKYRESVNDLTLDNSGNIIAVGSAWESLYFGNQDTLQIPGNSVYGYIAKFSPTGFYTSGRLLFNNGSYDISPEALACDNQNNMYIGGKFEGKMKLEIGGQDTSYNEILLEHGYYGQVDFADGFLYKIENSPIIQPDEMTNVNMRNYDLYDSNYNTYNCAVNAEINGPEINNFEYDYMFSPYIANYYYKSKVVYFLISENLEDLSGSTETIDIYRLRYIESELQGSNLVAMIDGLQKDRTYYVKALIRYRYMNEMREFSKLSDNYLTINKKTDGYSLWAWGANKSGQLANGSVQTEAAPIRISPDKDWVAVSCGNEYTMAIKSNGTLWGVGANYLGQLGDGSNINRNQLVQIGTDFNWLAVSCGYAHTLALKNDGSLWAWGNNNSGQLGDNSTTNKNIPIRIGTENDWVSVDAGSYHSIASKRSGQAYSWGANTNGELGGGTKIGKLLPTPINYLENSGLYFSAGNGFSLATVKTYDSPLFTKGMLRVWGDNSFGQLGIGDDYKSDYPMWVMYYIQKENGEDSLWSEVKAGTNHSLGIMSGRILAWGDNSNGQLGTGNTAKQISPTQVGGGDNWISVDCGGYNSVAIEGPGKLYQWGEHNDAKQPAQIGTYNNWATVVCGTNHFVALKAIDTVKLNTKPVLLTPENQTTSRNYWIWFDWEDIPGAITYKLELSSYINDTLVVGEFTCNESWKNMNIANKELRVYWRVKTFSDTDSSEWSDKWSFITYSEFADRKPVLKAPDNNSYDVSLLPTFEWFPVDSATVYVFEIASDTNFNQQSTYYRTFISQAVSTTLSNDLILQKNTTYYWRVKAVHGEANSMYSNVWSFKTINPIIPPVPTLIYPSIGETGISLTPTLSWTNSAGANSYRLQVALDEQFSNLITNQITSNTEYALNSLNHDLKYYWRVCAKSISDSSDWAIGNFTTNENTKLTIPVLIYPNLGATNISISPELSWNNVNGANSYLVQVSKDNQFSDLIISDTVTSPFKSLIDLDYNAKYYWRVRAQSNDDTSAYSAINYFNTIQSANLASPVLLYPGVNAIDVSISPTLQWEAVSGANSYRVQLSLSSNFSSLIVNKEISSVNYPLNGLSNNQQYYWRICAKVSNDSSAWSQRTFTTVPLFTLATPTLVYPSNNAIDIQPSLLLRWNNVDGANEYWIIVSKTNDFADTVANHRSASINYSVPGLQLSTTYYWKVKAINGIEISDWSPAWKFETSSTLLLPEITLAVVCAESYNPNEVTIDKPVNIPIVIQNTSNYDNTFKPDSVVAYFRVRRSMFLPDQNSSQAKVNVTLADSYILNNKCVVKSAVESLNNGQILLYLPGWVLLGDQESTPVILDSVQWIWKDYNAQRVFKTICIEDSIRLNIKHNSQLRLLTKTENISLTKVFPIPLANNMLNLSIENRSAHTSIIDIKLYNESGKMLESFGNLLLDIGLNNLELSMQEQYPNGNYIIEICNGNSAIYGKLLINK